MAALCLWGESNFVGLVVLVALPFMLMKLKGYPDVYSRSLESGNDRLDHITFTVHEPCNSQYGIKTERTNVPHTPCPGDPTSKSSPNVSS